jgi:hypothetical protein
VRPLEAEVCVGVAGRFQFAGLGRRRLGLGSSRKADTPFGRHAIDPPRRDRSSTSILNKGSHAHALRYCAPRLDVALWAELAVRL